MVNLDWMMISVFSVVLRKSMLIKMVGNVVGEIDRSVLLMVNLVMFDL